MLSRYYEQVASLEMMGYSVTLWVRWFWQTLRSMELAVVLLVVLALACLLGVLFPQTATTALTDIQRQFGAAYPWLQALGLFQVFSAPWFLALEGLLFASILVGSFRWLRPAFNSATLVTYMAATHIRATATGTMLPLPALSSSQQAFQGLVNHLAKAGFRVHVAPHSNRLYVHRGNIGRLAPIVAHLALLLILLAALYGGFTNFTAQVLQPPGQPFSLAQSPVFNRSVPEPFWLGRIPQWRVVVQDFHIRYYPQRPTVAQQYYTTLKIVSPPDERGQAGRVLARGSLSVNQPFQFDGVTFYQASFAPTGRLFVEVNGKPLVVALSQQLNGQPYAVVPLTPTSQLLLFPFFRHSDQVPTNHLQVFYQQAGRIVGLPAEEPSKGGPRPSASGATSSSAKQATPSLYVPEGERQARLFHGQRIRYIQPEWATGLQMKSAPEVPLMYAGFILLSVGVLLALVVQRQGWLHLCQDELSGQWQLWHYTKTRKQKARFRQQWDVLLQQYVQELTAQQAEGAHAGVVVHD